MTTQRFVEPEATRHVFDERITMLNLENRHGIAVLTIAHGKANAIDSELLVELEHKLIEVQSAEIRALIITGRGSIFSAGVDLFRVLAEDIDYLEEFVALLSRALLRLYTLPIPVVIAINGHAIAGGCILAACGDHRIMSSGTGKIGVSELLVGVPFPVVPFEILRAAVPRRSFSELVLSGKLVTPEQGVELGLVDRICSPDDLIDQAQEMAETLAKIPMDVFGLTKRQLQQPALVAIESARATFDEDIRSSWCAPATRQRIADYLDSTVRSRREST